MPRSRAPPLTQHLSAGQRVGMVYHTDRTYTFVGVDILSVNSQDIIHPPTNMEAQCLTEVLAGVWSDSD